jgi:hypothetical protein
MATTKRARAKSTTPRARKTATPDVAKVTTIDISEAIRVRAYQFFEQRGYQHGQDFDDWLRAEAEVLERFEQRTA